MLTPLQYVPCASVQEEGPSPNGSASMCHPNASPATAALATNSSQSALPALLSPWPGLAAHASLLSTPELAATRSGVNCASPEQVWATLGGGWMRLEGMCAMRY